MENSKMLILCVLIIVVTLNWTESACPDGWLRHGQSCYLFSHDKEDWTGAYMRRLLQDVCKILGGYLVEIESAEENNLLYQFVKELNRYYWIGLTDVSEEGAWMWMTSMLYAKAKYLNWSPGEPSQTDANNEFENCGQLYNYNGQWNDALCSSQWFYICEKIDETPDFVG